MGIKYACRNTFKRDQALLQFLAFEIAVEVGWAKFPDLSTVVFIWPSLLWFSAFLAVLEELKNLSY